MSPKDEPWYTGYTGMQGLRESWVVPTFRWSSWSQEAVISVYSSSCASWHIDIYIQSPPIDVIVFANMYACSTGLLFPRVREQYAHDCTESTSLLCPPFFHFWLINLHCVQNFPHEHHHTSGDSKYHSHGWWWQLDSLKAREEEDRFMSVCSECEHNLCL